MLFLPCENKTDMVMAVGGQPACFLPCENKTDIIIIIIIIIIMIIIIIIIVIAFKSTIQDFLRFPHCAANRLQHVQSSGPGATLHLSCAACRFTCLMVRRDSSACENNTDMVIAVEC